MASKIPQLHRDLLQKQVARLRPADLDSAQERYKHARLLLKNTGLRMIDTLFIQLDALHLLLENPSVIEDAHRDAAIAAMMYFLKDDDLITDDYQLTGLVDDALVVEAAVELIGDALRPHLEAARKLRGI